ncbi:MAG: hypothetical protein HRT88_23095 [Lentisphaeraceae bacterium]|nr:hypothetical protein [Lentisphaeraceae bacterium]
MLEITVDGEKILIDVTNGNLPLLFLDEKDSHLRYRSGLKCRMVYQTDKLHLYPSTEIAGDIMLTISEYMSQCQTFKYIFSQQLGLLISDEFYVTAFADWHEQRSRSMQQYYSRLAQKSALPFPIFFHRENCNSIEDEWISQLMQKSLQALYENYPLQEYRGDFTIVLQKLIPRRKVRLSSSLRHKMLTPENIGVPS